MRLCTVTKSVVSLPTGTVSERATLFVFVYPEYRVSEIEGLYPECSGIDSRLMSEKDGFIFVCFAREVSSRIKQGGRRSDFRHPAPILPLIDS